MTTVKIILSIFRQSLHVSGIFVAHHQEAYCTNTTIGTRYDEKKVV